LSSEKGLFDVFTRWKISVEPASDDGAYIIVPAEQVAALCWAY